MAIRYAKEASLDCHIMYAKWRPGGRYDPTAGFKRNKRMAEYADTLIAFSLGTPGTTNMIEQMTALYKPVTVIDL
jgi:hypothetical protein